MLHLLSVVDCRHKTVEKDKIGLTVPADDDESNDNDCDGTSHGFTIARTGFSAFEENCLERGEFRLEEEIEETQLLDYNKAIRHAAAATLVHFDPTLNYSSGALVRLSATQACQNLVRRTDSYVRRSEPSGFLAD
eukprot:766643-Hanusia_phi.AAC.10